MSTSRMRLDQFLVERGLSETRSQAQGMILAGEVHVNGQRVDKAGTAIAPDAFVELRRLRPRFVSRGGEKMLGALQAFAPVGLNVEGRVAADFGASTGGFVDCLLQSGASRVHAIDVGYGLLHPSLRSDSRVVVHERTNARNLTPDVLGEVVDLVVVDASFISIAKLLEATTRVLRPNGELLALIKPQFEAGRQEARRTQGVIRDPALREQIIARVIEHGRERGYDPLGDAPSVLSGPKGNLEHFLYARLAQG